MDYFKIVSKHACSMMQKEIITFIILDNVPTQPLLFRETPSHIFQDFSLYKYSWKDSL